MADNDTFLIAAVLEQLNVTKLDYALLATAIGSPTANAARVKWARFKKKLDAKNGGSPGKPTGVTKSAGKSANRTPTKEKGVKAETSDEATEDDQVSISPIFQV